MDVSSAGKVFGIGLSKTGTTSLYAALHRLGYRAGTYRHLRTLGLEDWFRGDFRRDRLRDYDAVTDLPVGAFFPQLDRRYPSSKFVLTVRDREGWLESCRRFFAGRDNGGDRFYRDVQLAAYGCVAFSETRFRYVHETHRRNVEWYFRERPDDLLVLDLFAGDGWPELCRFLGRDVPAASFPNVKPGYDPDGARRDASRWRALLRRVVGVGKRRR